MPQSKALEMMSAIVIVAIATITSAIVILARLREAPTLNTGAEMILAIQKAPNTKKLRP
jgi:hypothetical protein